MLELASLLFKLELLIQVHTPGPRIMQFLELGTSCIYKTLHYVPYFSGMYNNSSVPTVSPYLQFEKKSLKTNLDCLKPLQQQ